jgi:GNAT superfamily N-acetyltransferase
MSVLIRSAVLETDREDLIELFRRHLTPLSDTHRFDWLYCQSPCGAARAWVACNGADGAVVGAAAAFPRRIYLDGAENLGWVLGDFCLEEEYRSLGPAVQLQRACLEAVASPHEFCYDFPSQSMMAVYKRLGVRQTGCVVRWAKPLRVEQKLKSVVGSETIANMLGVMGNAALARRGYKGEENGCEVTLHEGACEEEFSMLDRKLPSSPGVRTVRSAEYLNWRYLAHPSQTHEILTARREGALVGYVVLTNDSKVASIVDLFAVEEPAVIAWLLSAAVDRIRRRGAPTASLIAGDGHPWSNIFERAGFRRRETSPVVVCGEKGTMAAEASFQKNWYLMQGERDS